jgi:hypothetical protein
LCASPCLERLQFEAQLLLSSTLLEGDDRASDCDRELPIDLKQRLSAVSDVE